MIVKQRYLKLKLGRRMGKLPLPNLAIERLSEWAEFGLGLGAAGDNLGRCEVNSLHINSSLTKY